MKKSIIVAVDQEYGIGKDGQIPWHYPDDLKYFKFITKNSVCVMGRKSFEDIYEFATSKGWSVLPHRYLIVLTSQNSDSIKTSTPNCKYPLDDRILIVDSVSHINELVSTGWLQSESTFDKLFYCGGKRVYENGVEEGIDEAYITYVPGTYDCDVKVEKMVKIIEQSFQVVEEEKDNETGLVYTKYVREWS